MSLFLKENVAEKVLQKLESELQKRALNIKMIYSSVIDLDIVPSHSNKGQAMQFLRKKWNFVVEQTIVCGIWVMTLPYALLVRNEEFLWATLAKNNSNDTTKIPLITVT